MGSKAGFFSRLILPQQHKHHPQAALLELQGLARGQECMLLGWCCCWVHFSFLTHIMIFINSISSPQKFLGKDLGIYPLHPGFLIVSSPRGMAQGNPTASPGPPPSGVAACRAEPGLAAAASQAHGKLFGTTLKCLGRGLAAEIKNHETWVEKSSQLQGEGMVC